MTVKEITDRTIMEIGQFISIPLAITLINEASNLLAIKYDTAAPTQVITYNGKSYTLPDDCIGVNKVSVNGQKHDNYTISDNTITFPTQGDYEITIQTVPQEVETEYDEPDINVNFHPVLYKYLASRATRPINQDYEIEFYRLADDINSRISRKKRSSFRLPARVWR